jgi:DNA invertase Pin-like site-specific DNA recombinase
MSVESSVRAALYARVSTTDQNCTLQLNELREYCQRRKWQITAEYVDTGVSGTKASRPQLDRLMHDASQHKFDAIAVYKLDRFGRSVLNLSQSLAALDSYGVRFISTSQGLDTDQSNPTSRLLLNILSSVAAFELDLIRERTAAGVRVARSKGKTIGRPRRVFRRDEAIRLRSEGWSWRRISSELGVPVMTIRDAVASGTYVESGSAEGEIHDVNTGTSVDQFGVVDTERNPYGVGEALA